MNKMLHPSLTITCPWCSSPLIPVKDNALAAAHLLWHCYCGGDPIDINLNFDIVVDKKLNVIGFNVIKDCVGGFLQCGWQNDYHGEDDTFYPANWDLLLSNIKKTEIKTIRAELGIISPQEARDIVLRYEKLLVFL